MRWLRIPAVALACLSTLWVGVANGAERAPAPTAAARCQAARQLARELPDLAREQYEKALEVRDAQCAVDALVAQAVADKQKAQKAEAQTAQKAKAPPEDCDPAARSLRDADLLAEAEEAYKALLKKEGVAERACGVAGLTKIKQLRDDDRAAIPWREASDTVREIAASAVPWIVFVLALRLLAWLVRGAFPAKRIAVHTADKALAEQVVEAVDAAGGGSAPPAKLLVAPTNALPEGTVTDLSKLLGVPGGAALAAIAKYSWLPLLHDRFAVACSTAAGSTVVDVHLRRPAQTSLSARFALRLGDASDAERREIAALLAAAWLTEAVNPDATATWTDEEGPAVIAHAAFRTGAVLQSRDCVSLARACYAAMPELADPWSAPFAWIGARLNLMAALQREGRWTEAVRYAEAIERFLQAELTPVPAAEQERYGLARLEDLRRHAWYMVAVMRVSRCHVATSRHDDAAGVAVTRLASELVGATGGIKVAMQLTVECYRLLGRGPRFSRDEFSAVTAILVPDADGPVRTDTPLLTAAAYWDGACALGLLLRLPPIPTSTRGDAAKNPSACELREQVLVQALAWVQLAVRATQTDRRKRVIAGLQKDPMLDTVRLDPRWAQALADPDGDPPVPPPMAPDR